MAGLGQEEVQVECGTYCCVRKQVSTRTVMGTCEKECRRQPDGNPNWPNLRQLEHQNNNSNRITISK